MTNAAARRHPQEARAAPAPSSALRWLGAAAVAALAHAGLIWIAIDWLDSAAAPPAALETAVLIDLEPVAAPAAEGPAPAQPPSVEKPPTDAPADTPPMDQLAPDPPALEPTPQQPVQEPVQESPPPPAAVQQKVPPPPTDAEAVLPPPRPKERPKPEPPARPKPMRSAPVPARQQPRPTPPRETSVVRPATASTARASEPAPSAADRANWQSAVAAHINRFKRAPSNGATGVARVAFRIDAGGRVLSASIVASSGDPVLDGEALGLVRRASPVPAPPRGSAGALALVVPVRFTQ